MKSVLLFVTIVLAGGLALNATPFQGTPPATGAPGDKWLAHPVDDKTFNTYLDFFAYDKKLPLDSKATKIEGGGLIREHLSYQSTSGVRVPAILYQAATPAGAKPPALVVLHGGESKGKDATGAIRMAELLNRAGWTVLAIDLPYFGERSTTLLTTFSDPEKHERLYNQPPLYLAWVTQSVKDISRGVDLLVNERGVDPGRVGIFGASRGAIVASIAAGVDRRLSPVVLFYGGHYDALENNHLGAACPANYIGRISPRLLLMMNGEQDSDMIKDRAVDPFYKLAKQPKQIIWTGGGHMFATDEHRAALLQWLRDHQK
jgi:dipeptidyl aminopeptidase/acylaminoacyl peptidase